jgi:hypothetical protein
MKVFLALVTFSICLSSFAQNQNPRKPYIGCGQVSDIDGDEKFVIQLDVKDGEASAYFKLSSFSSAGQVVLADSRIDLSYSSLNDGITTYNAKKAGTLYILYPLRGKQLNNLSGVYTYKKNGMNFAVAMDCAHFHR